MRTKENKKARMFTNSHFLPLANFRPLLSICGAIDIDTSSWKSNLQAYGM